MDADSCIPEGATINGHSGVFYGTFQILACGGLQTPDYVSISGNGYEAFWGAPDAAVVWSCTSAAYDGCQVSYTQCSGWLGDAGCNITSTQLTFGPYGNGTLAHGVTSWSCDNSCGSGSNITFLYPQP